MLKNCAILMVFFQHMNLIIIAVDYSQAMK